MQFVISFTERDESPETYNKSRRTIAYALGLFAALVAAQTALTYGMNSM